MLLFSGHPNGEEDLSRYQRVCEAYLNVLGDSAAIDQVDPNALQMVTVWPRTDLTTEQSFDPENGDVHRECQIAISHYAYPAAHVWMKKFEASGAHISLAQGPYLVAWAQDPVAGNAVTILTLDLSAMESSAEIENAFRLWANQIEEDPHQWQKSWRPDDWKFYAAGMLNAYGQRVVDAIAIVKHAGFIG